jgi:hypothetical protein
MKRRMQKLRLFCESAILLVLLSACGGATTPGSSQAAGATPQLAPAAPYLYTASGGTGGSGTYSWSHEGGEHCRGTLHYLANIDIKLASSGKVEADGSTIAANGTFEPVCKAWGVTTFQITFSASSGHVSEKGVAVEGTLQNGFCLPGEASGSATLVGAVDNAHLFVSNMFEKCKDFKTSISIGKVLIHDIKGQLFSH